MSPGCFDKGGISRYNRYQITALREIVGAKNVKVFSLIAPAEGDFEDFFEVNWNGWGTARTSKAIYIARVLLCTYIWKPDVIWLGHVNLTEILVRFNLWNRVTSVLNIYGLEIWSGLRPKVELGLRKVNHVISDCYFTANYSEEAGFRPRNSIEVIWDCVDLTKFCKKKSDDFYKKYHLPDPEKNPWVLTLGRISKTAAHKGYDRLMSVFEKVCEQNKDAVLVYAGKGDLIEDLKKKAEELKISNRVFFSGMVHEEDISKFYSAAAIFSLVSDRGVGRGEGIPLTPLEAMACGTPIIVGNHDGSQEAIIHEKNGSCIDPFDFERHTSVIIDLLENKQNRMLKSNSATEIARAYFSYEGFKDKHILFINKID